MCMFVFECLVSWPGLDVLHHGAMGSALYKELSGRRNVATTEAIRIGLIFVVKLLEPLKKCHMHRSIIIRRGDT